MSINGEQIINAVRAEDQSNSLVSNEYGAKKQGGSVELWVSEIPMFDCKAPHEPLRFLAADILVDHPAGLAVRSQSDEVTALLTLLNQHVRETGSIGCSDG